ncbi:MAG TPA: hypothetical protein VFE07_01895 [Marmoricola sp.]|nr:hypothetical protein [Marmoricola sp.]
MDDSASGSARGTTVIEEVATTPGPSPRPRGLLAGLGLAILTVVVAWLFGNLPWVVSGFSWPTTEAAPVGSSTEGLSGVRLTIPLVAAYLPSLIAFTAIGSVAAALLPLVLTTRAGRRLPAIAVVLAALVATTVLVVLVARSTIEAHAADAFAGDSRVLLGLVLVVLATAAVGALLGTLASIQVGFLPLAAAFAAGQVPVWLDGFLVDKGPGFGTARTLDHVGEVLVLLLLLVAFVLSVRRSPWWALLWPVAIAMVWTATPFRIMTIQLAGRLRPSAGLPDTLGDVLQGGVDVFRASFWEAPQARWPWAVALVLALLWMAVERRTSTVATSARQ